MSDNTEKNFIQNFTQKHQHKNQTTHNYDKSQSNEHNHEEKLKQKFLQSGLIGFHDYEIIELVLFHVLPQQDITKISKALIEKFSNINNIFFASKKDIMAIKGCEKGVYQCFKLFSEISRILAREQLNCAPLLSKWSELCDYLRLKIAYLTHEEFHVLFLDTHSYLIEDKMLFRGTVDKSTIYPKEIIKYALECGASGIVLAHNHPSGDATPSHDDIQITNQITQAAKIMEIHIIDHIIVGKYDLQSFKNLGML